MEVKNQQIPHRSGAYQPRQPAVDTKRLSALESLRGIGDKALLDRLIGLYLLQVPDLLETIEAALAGRNTAALARASHTLKSSSATLGAQPMSRIAEALEDDADLGRLDAAPVLLAALRAEYPRVRDGLLGYRPPPDAEAA